MTVSEEILRNPVIDAYQNIGWKLLQVPKNTLNLAFTGALTLIGLWRRDIPADRTIELIHDSSNELLKQQDLWNAVVDANVSSELIGYDTRTYNFPLAVTKTMAGEDSRNWAGLQIADLLAGACVDAMKWLLDDNRKEEGLAYELNQIMNSGDFFIHGLWNQQLFTPEELGTTGQNALPLFEKFSKILEPVFKKT